jgi:tetratricopeptide (TPR) repeat protein
MQVTFRFDRSIALMVCMSVFAAIADGGGSAEAAETATSTAAAISTTSWPGYVGSSQCRECHERFYQLWSTSHHGLAMQPYTSEFAAKELTSQSQEVVVGPHSYRVEMKGDAGWVREKGPQGEKRYPIHHAMGGKNVYYFLTPLDRGRLQVLPVAFNVRTKQSYNATASMVRHFIDRTEEPVHWTDPLLTFNSACHGCHVSQMSSNYDFKADSYDTVWTEPGINCETCHGPAEEHIRVCRAAPTGQPPKDLKLITVNRRNGRDGETISAHCSPCHAKMYPLSASFKPGDRYFDHYGLIALENPDFYPDGRDLAENYTYTLWRMNPCAQTGQLDCMHCHTSSGRYRFSDPTKANEACLPCHAERVKDGAAHTHHKADGEGSRCIACHMPMTEFALMRRSDHSMLPPAPSATLRFKSPNACNICHADKDAAWSDKYVREWRSRDYQAPVLHRAGLIEAARRRDWSRLPEMLEYVGRKDRDEVFAASLIRLLQSCPDARKWPAVFGALKDASPLVRSAAAGALDGSGAPEARSALTVAAGDDWRVVRVAAAASLAGYSREGLSGPDRERIKRASDEYEAMLRVRMDDWSSHYNLGNFYGDQGDSKRALESYGVAMRLDPKRVPPLVNASMVHARRGETAKAESMLKRALELEPANPEANFNLGLLLAELGDRAGAEQRLRAAWKADGTLAGAAFNLAVLVAEPNVAEAIDLCRQAARLRPDEPRYAYTLAFYLARQSDYAAATAALNDVIRSHPAYGDAYFLLGDLYEKQGKTREARKVYEQALGNLPLSERDRLELEFKIRSLR